MKPIIQIILINIQKEKKIVYDLFLYYPKIF